MTLISLLVNGLRVTTFLGMTLVVIACGMAAEPQVSSLRQLGEFGDVTPKQLVETFQTAIAELRKSGGVLSLTTDQWMSQHSS